MIHFLKVIIKRIKILVVHVSTCRILSSMLFTNVNGNALSNQLHVNTDWMITPTYFCWPALPGSTKVQLICELCMRLSMIWKQERFLVFDNLFWWKQLKFQSSYNIFNLRNFLHFKLRIPVLITTLKHFISYCTVKYSWALFPSVLNL